MQTMSNADADGIRTKSNMFPLTFGWGDIILVRFLKFKLLKLISTTTVFLVIVMLKLTKFHEIKGNNSFRLQHFSTDTWYSAVNQSNINLKVLQLH